MTTPIMITIKATTTDLPTPSIRPRCTSILLSKIPRPILTPITILTALPQLPQTLRSSTLTVLMFKFERPAMACSHQMHLVSNTSISISVIRPDWAIPTATTGSAPAQTTLAKSTTNATKFQPETTLLAALRSALETLLDGLTLRLTWSNMSVSIFNSDLS